MLCSIVGKKVITSTGVCLLSRSCTQLACPLVDIEDLAPVTPRVVRTHSRRSAVLLPTRLNARTDAGSFRLNTHASSPVAVNTRCCQSRLYTTLPCVEQSAAAPPPLEPHQQPQPFVKPLSSFFKKPIPEACTPLNSKKGKGYFASAMQQGNLEGTFWSLVENFQTQSEPSSCGTGTLAMVLNSMGVDPGHRSTLGPWRWWTEQSLSVSREKNSPGGDGDGPPAQGITLQQLARLAEKNGASVKMHNGGSGFRADLQALCGGEDTGRRIIASFSRLKLGQTGDGHHSPIAAYDSESDQVLVLDVARFKYAPWWVPVSMMEEALNTTDTCGQQRGYMVLDPCAAWRPEL